MKLTDIILGFVVRECPLCKEPFRNKSNLRKHLNREHTEIEAEKFIKKNKVQLH